jgi:hypothetical protein
MPQYRREFLLNRAAGRCEYCHTPAEFLSLDLQVEHVIARQHGGNTIDDILAMACATCNLFKGPNLAGMDPVTGELTRLFNPRRDEWLAHFVCRRDRIIGRTPVGRTTARVLNMNNPSALTLRRSLRELGISLN